MNESEENIVYDALKCLMDNSKAICDLVNKQGTSLEKKGIS
jgi:hypothetical protein